MPNACENAGGLCALIMHHENRSGQESLGISTKGLSLSLSLSLSLYIIVLAPGHSTIVYIHEMVHLYLVSKSSQA